MNKAELRYIKHADRTTLGWVQHLERLCAEAQADADRRLISPVVVDALETLLEQAHRTLVWQQAEVTAVKKM